MSKFLKVTSDLGSTSDAGEDFADRFAQALLFSESHAAKLRAELQGARSVAARSARIRQVAKRYIISPYTIRLAIQGYEQARGLPRTDLGEVGAFMASVANFGKGYKTVSQIVFKQLPPEPKAYAAVARSAFNSPSFEALVEFCKQEQGVEQFIHCVLGVSLADAKALAGELGK